MGEIITQYVFKRWGQISRSSFLLTQVPTLLPSWFSALGRGGLSGQRGSSLIGRSLVTGTGPQAEGSRLTGVSWSPPSPSLQDEPTIHSVLSEPQDPIALEKEAASDGSQALADQADGAACGMGSDIKTETLEDDWRGPWIPELSESWIEQVC